VLVVLVLAAFGVVTWQTWDHWRVVLGLSPARHSRDGRRFRGYPPPDWSAPDPAAADALDWEMRDRVTTALEIHDAAEWAAIEPKVRAVVRLQQQLPGVGEAPHDSAPRDSAAPSQDLPGRIAAVREQRAQVRADLKRAQDDLRKSVTRKQEAALVLLGLLD